LNDRRRAPYDGVVFEMEHNPYDVRVLRDCMQYMRDRRQIVRSGGLAPAVAPMVRIPPNGAEMNQCVDSDRPRIRYAGQKACPVP
jgi:hypothetical protein